MGAYPLSHSLLPYLTALRSSGNLWYHFKLTPDYANITSVSLVFAVKAIGTNHEATVKFTQHNNQTFHYQLRKDFTIHWEWLRA